MKEPQIVQPYDETAAARLIEAAQEYRGTRWQWQGRTAQGIDCCGFVVQCCVTVKVVPDVQFIQDYQHQSNSDRMLELLESYLDYVDEGEERPGDIFALCDEQRKFPTRPTHLSLFTTSVPYWKMIHASEHGVIEHRMDAWFKKRVASRWRPRGVYA
jgi:cell wall-associated NlpC family hydrolase